MTTAPETAPSTANMTPDSGWTQRYRLRLRVALEELIQQPGPIPLAEVQTLAAARVPLNDYDESVTKSGAVRAWNNLGWLLTTSFEHAGWLHATADGGFRATQQGASALVDHPDPQSLYKAGDLAYRDWDALRKAENRLIRSAALALLALPGLPAGVEADLRRVDRVLVEAERLVPGAALPAWQPTRLNARLHALLGLAELTLRHVSVESAAGDTVVHGFRVNMAHLFERLVARLLADVDPTWSAQVTLPLDRRKTLEIRPDLVRDGGTGWSGVADTKYKVLDEAGKVSNADIYQLVTYCARLGLTTGHLIYADGGTAPLPYEVRGADAAIAVHRVDLSAPPRALRAEVSALAATLAPAPIERELRMVETA